MIILLAIRGNATASKLQQDLVLWD